MQIFIMDYCPIVSAQILFDRSPIRARKQISEAVQVLCDACDNPIGGCAPYNPAHPIVTWAKESETNMLWIMRNLEVLAGMHYQRSKKQHGSFTRYLKIVGEINDYIDSYSYPHTGMTAVDFSRFKKSGLADFADLEMPEAYTKHLNRKLQKEVK
jgi:hypothetical protein